MKKFLLFSALCISLISFSGNEQYYIKFIKEVELQFENGEYEKASRNVDLLENNNVKIDKDFVQKVKDAARWQEQGKEAEQADSRPSKILETIDCYSHILEIRGREVKLDSLTTGTLIKSCERLNQSWPDGMKDPAIGKRLYNLYSWLKHKFSEVQKSEPLFVTAAYLQYKKAYENLCDRYAWGQTKDIKAGLYLVEYIDNNALLVESRYTINSIGSIYYDNKRYQNAYDWWSKGAEQGYSCCIGNLGLLYENGYFVQKNLRQAKRQYEADLAIDPDSEWSKNRLDNVSKRIMPKGRTDVRIEMQRVMADLSNSLFDTGKAVIKDAAKGPLYTVVMWLKENPNAKVEVSGHTDNVGSYAYNQDLSERRAKAVYDYFVACGVGTSRLSYAGYGHVFPIADNNTIEGRQMNNRIELYILEK